VENSVEKVYDDMLDSIKSVNDEFINNYFENSEFNLENQEELDEESEELTEENENLVVENFVENNSDILTNSDNCLENIEIMSVENLEDMVIPVEEIEKTIEEQSIDEDYSMNIDELNLEDESLDIEEDLEQEELTEEYDLKIESIDKKFEDYSNEELIELIDETDSSEEFFDKLGF